MMFCLLAVVVHLSFELFPQLPVVELGDAVEPTAGPKARDELRCPWFHFSSFHHSYPGNRGSEVLENLSDLEKLVSMFRGDWGGV